MKMLKISILAFAALFMLVLTSISSFAETETDGTNDIFHYKATGSSWSWEAYSGEKADIDLTSVGYSISGLDVTVTFTVLGTIQTSDNVAYYVYLVSDQGSYYVITTNNYASWVGSGGYSGEGGEITNFTISGNTFTATFSPSNPISSYNVYCYAWETDASTNEIWSDYAPNSYAPWYNPADDNQNSNSDGNTSSGNQNKGTPGFEAIILIAAIGAVLIILRRKK